VVRSLNKITRGFVKKLCKALYLGRFVSTIINWGLEKQSDKDRYEGLKFASKSVEKRIKMYDIVQNNW